MVTGMLHFDRAQVCSNIDPYTVLAGNQLLVRTRANLDYDANECTFWYPGPGGASARSGVKSRHAPLVVPFKQDFGVSAVIQEGS
jgi:hypothetical protein